MQQPAVRDPFFDQKPERVWILLSNVCDKGKFKVTLEVNGREKRMFHSYVEQGEVVVSESHNLTWLFDTRDAEIKRLREALECIDANWDASNPECVVPRHHPGELAPNDSLAAGSIIKAKYVLNAITKQSPVPSLLSGAVSARGEEMRKYTPGPWRVVFEGDGPKAQCAVIECGNGRYPQILVDHRYDLTYPVYDARLIAAAPELLETLKELTDVFKSNIAGSQDKDLHDRCLALIAGIEKRP